MQLTLRPCTGLNLTLEGSVGKFKIGSPEGANNDSLEVLYLATHIGFDPAVASNERMLRRLEPVREIFDFQSLSFDEIMQRDIDDVRVSTELIPYLLDADARDTIKFFPPIIVVVLPFQDRLRRHDTLYPEVTRFGVDNDPERGVAEVIRAGAVGAEAFQFEYPIVEGVARQHDLVRLKLNTNRVRLVIIDGQHRAMALLALYRNLRDDWNDAKRMPFKDYYREWTKNRIMSFDLSELQLPVIVCTYPGLDADYQGDFDIIRAARTTFLTLNKTARVVSNSRNILLDDRDLISHFLRDSLGHIKQKDVHSSSSMRIWNVELDQYRDRVKIESPVACTGVSHVYYAIEHMLLDDNDVKGLSARSGKFHKRAYVEGSLLRRLDGENLLGRETAATLKRHTYTTAAAKELADAFHDRYGQFLTGVFDVFKPFDLHNKAAMEIERLLQGHTNPQIRTILFEGQNIGRTFSDYLDYMVDEERKAKDARSPLAPELQSILAILRGTAQAVETTRQNLLQRRAELYVEGIPDRSKLKNPDGEVSKNLRRLLDDLYDDVFTSVAFQAALVCGYFLVVEKAERLVSERGATLVPRTQSFAEYIESLNAFFVPTTLPRLKNLLKVFFYDVEGERAEVWKPIPTGETLGVVVFRGEMKPDEWPKYRYVLLELWRPNDAIVEEVRKAERDLCRRQAFESLHARRARETCVELRKNEEDLTDPEWKDIFDRSFRTLEGLLRNLGVKPEDRMTEAQARDVIARPEPVSAEAEAAMTA
jgi:hypothetical protein